jgi:UDP-N-acetylmuramate dehydrogenase
VTTDRRIIDEAAAQLGELVRRDVPLGPLTTYRVGGSAALLAHPRNAVELATIAETVRSTGVELLVVGRGSNLLVADAGFSGLVVTTGGFDDDSIGFAPADSGAATHVCAASGVLLPVLARRSAAHGLTGLEWAVGVPGSVGGGVKMNAGGHGSDIAATLVSADIFDIKTSRRRTVPAGDLGLRFRRSDIAGHQLVLQARFALGDGDRARSELELAEIVKWRRQHQPGGQNAGSVFVNPVPGEIAAGELIDRLGLRGFRIGSAEVSTKHANFIQADDGGTAADVRAVIEYVRKRVLDGFGLDLRSEIKLVGFDDVAGNDPAAVLV